jgi:hypothetical protein
MERLSVLLEVMVLVGSQGGGGMVEFWAVRFAGLLDGFVLHYGFAVVAKSADRFVDLFGH